MHISNNTEQYRI